MGKEASEDDLSPIAAENGPAKNCIVPKSPRALRRMHLAHSWYTTTEHSSARDKHCVMCPVSEGLTKAPTMLSMLQLGVEIAENL